MKKEILSILILLCIFFVGAIFGHSTVNCGYCNEYKLHSEYCIRCYDSCLDDIEKQKQLLRNCIYAQKETTLMYDRLISDIVNKTGIYNINWSGNPMVN